MPNDASSHAKQPIARQSIKERLENNIVLIVASTAVAAFGAGFGTHIKLEQFLTAPSVVSHPVDWETTARQSGWVQKTNCPAMPLKLRLISPGNNTAVTSKLGKPDFPTIITSPLPVPESDEFGVIEHFEGDLNYYVHFTSSFSTNSQRTRLELLDFKIYKTMDQTMALEMWGMVTGDPDAFGSVYDSLDAIKALSDSTVLSEKVVVKVSPSVTP